MTTRKDGAELLIFASYGTRPNSSAAGEIQLSSLHVNGVDVLGQVPQRARQVAAG